MDFSKLPETEKNYNLQMSTETLKYVAQYGLIFVAVLWFLKKKECRVTESKRGTERFITSKKIFAFVLKCVNEH